MKKTLRTPGLIGVVNVLFSGVLGLVWLWFEVAVVSLGLSTALTGGVGLVLLLLWLMMQRGINVVERRRSEAIYQLGYEFPPRVRSTRTGFVGWLDTNWKTLGEPVFWRETFLHFVKEVLGLFAVGLCGAFAVVSLLALAVAVNPDIGQIFLHWEASGTQRAFLTVAGVFGLVVSAAVLWFAAVADYALDSWLLATPQSQELKRELREVDRARVGAMDAATSERLRIERDLHDGIQPILVALSMKVGMAKAKLAKDPKQAQQLMEEAHADSKAAITELRELVRGIHPAVLTDRGLDPAISALAARSVVPVYVNVDVTRLPREIESVAYFVVAEGLSNMGKHAHATQARVDVQLANGVVRVVVSDNGRGGAHVSMDGSATGLAGLSQRVVAARGTFNLHSPVGGPTTITVELPCG